VNPFGSFDFGFWLGRSNGRITSFTLGALLLGLCSFVEAQEAKKIPRIGYLATNASATEAFLQGLRHLGYFEGKNITLEFRTTEGKPERYPDLIAELVRLKVDIIVVGGNSGIRAAKKATSTIPIVMTSVGDPVSLGLVASLARPGGNITGLTQMSPDLTGKRLELLKQLLPTVTQVSFISFRQKRFRHVTVSLQPTLRPIVGQRQGRPRFPCRGWSGRESEYEHSSSPETLVRLWVQEAPSNAS
jgi:ABC-type uncharacterized transport system substrate-binding protein